MVAIDENASTQQAVARKRAQVLHLNVN